MEDLSPIIDLTEETDQYVFPVPPSAVWLIFSLEFPTLYADKKYLLMTQPYYGDYTQNVNFGEGIWYPPFSAFPADLRFFPQRTLGEVREKLVDLEQQKFHSELIDEIAYNLGLGEPKYERIDEKPVDEYKLSPRSHNVYKFFRVIRFRCWHPAESGKRNLADPEVIKGITYVPIDVELRRLEPNSRLGPHKFRHFSKAIASHYERAVKTYKDERSMDKFTRVSSCDLVNSESGYLLFFDVSGFGRMEALTREKAFHPIEESGEIAKSFRIALSESFLCFFQALGISQYVTLGDGFIAGVPYRIINDKESFFRNFSDALFQLAVKIDEINDRVKNSGGTIGLRAAIVSGSYRYGKMAGLSSLRPEFDGTLLIDAARLDSGSKTLLANEQSKASLLVSSYDPELLNIDVCQGTKLSEFEIKVKEKKAKAFARIVDFGDL